MKTVIVQVTPQLLVQLFRFPAGTALVMARMSPDGHYVELTVTHPDLPDTPVDKNPPMARPHFQRVERSSPSIEFIAWGIEA